MRGSPDSRSPTTARAGADPAGGRGRGVGAGPISLQRVALASTLSEAPQTAAERYTLMRARAAWRQVVGPHLGGVSAPASLIDGRLTVTVRDAGWKKELERHASRILARLCPLLPSPRVGSIAFRVGSPAVADPQGASPGSTPGRERFSLPPRPPAGDGGSVPREGTGDLAAELEGVRDRYLAAARARASG